MRKQAITWEDVQGVVLSGFPAHPYSAFVMLKIDDAQEAKSWINRLLSDSAADGIGLVDAKLARRKPGESNEALAARLPNVIVNLAISFDGLKKLKLDKEGLASFPAEMQEGMAGNDRRRSMLGDIGNDDPSKWDWGGSDRTRPHILLMMYSKTEKDSNRSAVERYLKNNRGVSTIDVNDDQYAEAPIVQCYEHHERREHFGFRDGISQPRIEGTQASDGRPYGPNEVTVVKPGEILLGYKNERDLYPVSPSVSAKFDRGNHLGRNSGRRNIGKNGTYLVLRQLAQDVNEFEKFLDEAAAEQTRDRDDEANLEEDPRERVAARMMGRWRDGAPVVRHPHVSPKKTKKGTKGTIWDRDNQFLYHFEDPTGIKCPIGAHIRRANPRDSLEPDPETALRLSKRRRIMRRGRIYGPYSNGKSETNERRGLMFACLNADIAGQFELIQHSWMNNIHFADLYDERDPIAGLGLKEGERMTFQESPINQKTPPLKQFTSVRGGAYFFLPGINALRCIADSGEA